MNFSELLKLDIKDLKSLNLNDLKQTLIKRKDVSISLAVFLIAGVILSQLIKTKSQEASQLKQNIVDAEKKIEALKSYDQEQRALTDYLEKFPKGIMEDHLIDAISDFAHKNNVKILTFSPAQNQNADLYKLTVIKLDLSANKYADLFHFIHDIENSSSALIINNLYGNPEGDPSARRGQPSNVNQYTIRSNIEIGSIVLKEK